MSCTPNVSCPNTTVNFPKQLELVAKKIEILMHSELSELNFIMLFKARFHL